MSVDVAIVDYGLGNLFSVRRAVEHCGASVAVTDDVEIILAASRMILPGVGAFPDGMAGLKRRNLDGVVRDFAASRRPLLGICLGMQLLATIGEEFGQHAGLGIIEGRVARIPSQNSTGVRHKIPHVGWADLVRPAGSWAGTIFQAVAPGSAVYLTHSYALSPANEQHLLATYSYNEIAVTAAVRRENVYGVQFHPEKSGPIGLQMLAEFLRLGG